MRALQLVCMTAISLLVAATVQAESITTFESCIDAAGRTLPAVEDTTISKLVATSHEQSGANIRYNPSLLPRLKPMTRLFFFAHECARNALGDGNKAAMSVARAQQADCLGLATLLDEGLLKREELPELQADLNFSEAEWAMVPGLPRSFDLAACHSRGVVKLPLNAAPSGKQTGWDACVRTCAAPLLACGARCQENYDKCIAGCGGSGK